jgi:hypothetical protein
LKQTTSDLSWFVDHLSGSVEVRPEIRRKASAAYMAFRFSTVVCSKSSRIADSTLEFQMVAV